MQNAVDRHLSPSFNFQVSITCTKSNVISQRNFHWLISKSAWARFSRRLHTLRFLPREVKAIKHVRYFSHGLASQNSYTIFTAHVRKQLSKRPEGSAVSSSAHRPSLTQFVIYLLIYLFIYSFVCLFVYWLVGWFVFVYSYPFTQLHTRFLFYAFVNPSTKSPNT